MKRRSMRKAQKTDTCRTYIRVRIQDVYGGMIANRGQECEALAKLAASIARHGLLQPIIVRKNNQADRYALICGARRLTACRMLGMTEVDAICLDVDETAAAACFMEEHILRRTPCAMDEARVLDAVGKEAMLAETSLDPAAVEQRIRLLSLFPRTREIARMHRLNTGQALPLLAIEDEDRQEEAALLIAERALTPAQARRLVCGPERSCGESPAQPARRRHVRMVVGEMNAMVQRLRERGIEASAAVYVQEKGMCIQLLFAQEEKPETQQDLANRRRNT